MNRLLLITCFLAFSQDVSAQNKASVIKCALGRDGSRLVEVLRDHSIADTNVYYLRKDVDAVESIYPGDINESRGASMSFDCAGSPERALIISGEFTSNYVQGMVVRYNSARSEWERIDFAERGRPTQLYLGPAELIVAIPNLGHETSKTYILYRYISGKGQPSEPSASDALPRSAGKEVVFLKQGQ